MLVETFVVLENKEYVGFKVKEERVKCPCGMY